MKNERNENEMDRRIYAYINCNQQINNSVDRSTNSIKYSIKYRYITVVQKKKKNV